MSGHCWLCVLTLSLAAATVLGRPSSNVLSYYEPLSYDPSELGDQHSRVVRSSHYTKNPNAVRFQINAFNRSFVSSLTHARGVFGESVQFLVGGVKTDEYDPRTFYGGVLEGEAGSEVKGHITDGVFEGFIQTRQGTYHVELAHKFFPGPQPFHTIMYHSEDVRTPTASCGAKDSLLRHLNDVASRAVPLHEDRHRVYGRDKHVRLKRQISGNQRFCPIRVAADHLFLAEVGGGSVVNTMSQIVGIISGVQTIFKNTDFDGDGSPDSVQPVVVSLEVLDENAQGYRFGASSIDVNSFLDLWSTEDQSSFCLALLLTYRDFDMGVLGLAWVAAPAGGNRGGICEDGVQVRTGIRYLNTAIVTFLNFGHTQPQSVATVTIAHEFGHNFGSPHDPSGSCSPGGSQGNFLMFPQATDGSQDNNELFSSCSISSIRPVLETKSSSCFTATEAFCGNGIIEGSEECDCGTMCAQDSCCNGGNCTLTPGSRCSAVQECCDGACQFTTEMCLPQTECGEASFCTGGSGTCPAPAPRRGDRGDGLCNNNANVCVEGLCAGSICINRNATDCQCSISAGNDEAQLCHVCCIVGTGPCRSSFDLFPPRGGQLREGGRSCNNFAGYCSNDASPMCIIVDNERTLNDLFDIFNLNTLNAIAVWLQVYWYVPVAVVVAIAIIVFLLHITYRKRKPIKKGISRVRNSTLRRDAARIPPAASQPARSRGQQRPAGREISQGEGERRLKLFFPTADRETMVTVMRRTRSESKAVQKLLDLGYPLFKVPLPRS